VITMRLYKEIDIGVTYANVITSTYLDGGAIPLIMNTDRDAIQLACKSVVRINTADLKIVRIVDTLHLTQIQISEALHRDAVKRPKDFEILGKLEPLQFDSRGLLMPMNHTIDKRAVA
jgi:hypothetical protein